MQAIHALHRGPTTREQEVNSKQNSDALGHPDGNLRAPSPGSRRKAVSKNIIVMKTIIRCPSATVHRIGLLFPFAPVQVVKIPSGDQVLALFEDTLGQIHRRRTNIMEGTRITHPGS